MVYGIHRIRLLKIDFFYVTRIENDGFYRLDCPMYHCAPIPMEGKTS